MNLLHKLYFLDDSPNIHRHLQLVEADTDAGEHILLLSDIKGYSYLSMEQLEWIFQKIQHTIAHISNEEIDALEKQEHELREHELREQYNTNRLQKSMRQKKKKEGFVYIAKADKYFKIGCTKNPKNRILALDVKAPFPVKVVLLIPCEDMEETEKTLHKTFANQHIRGEWFDLTDSHIQNITESFPTTDPSICNVA